MNTMQPLFAKYKLFIVPEILEQTREERQTARGGNLIYSICKIKYTFYAEDGTSIYAVVIGEGMDSGDKATNKAMAIAMKYALFQVFCIPTEEMRDPDAETPPESVKIDAKIDAVKVQALELAIQNNNIPQEAVKTILSKFNCTDVKDITVVNYKAIVDDLKRYKEA